MATNRRHYDFFPESFQIPTEFHLFYAAWQRTKGTWIVKPAASSQGRGIYLIRHPNQLHMDSNTVVSRYIEKPFLINSRKFDLRLYVVILSTPFSASWGNNSMLCA